MFSYIKRHWPVYLILALIAIVLGFGAAYIVGVKAQRLSPRLAKKWSTSRVWEPMASPSPIKRSSTVGLHLGNSHFATNE